MILPLLPLIRAGSARLFMFRWRMIEGLDDCSCSKSCFLLGILSSRLDGFFLASAEDRAYGKGKKTKIKPRAISCSRSNLSQDSFRDGRRYACPERQDHRPL